jgi:hypothetical protein
LSGKAGTVYFVEPKSDNLRYIMNVDKASRLFVYYHKRLADDILRKVNKTYKILEPDQHSPFITDITPSRPLSVLICNPFHITIYSYHVKITDFLLVKD